MRVKRVWCAAFLLVLVVGITSGACSTKLDVVNHQPAVSGLYERIQQDQAVLTTLPPAQRAEYLREHWPNLEVGIVQFLRQRIKIRPEQEVQQVNFRFGSMDNVRAQGGDGQVREGYFRDQIVAVVTIRGVAQPISVIVQCLNELYALPGEVTGALADIGTSAPAELFTIGRGDGLMYHVDFPTAVALARQHRLLMYRGWPMSTVKRITPDEAIALEDRTDWVEVTVRVVEGDTFDLRTGQFLPSPLRQEW